MSAAPLYRRPASVIARLLVLCCASACGASEPAPVTAPSPLPTAPISALGETPRPVPLAAGASSSLSQNAAEPEPSVEPVVEVPQPLSRQRGNMLLVPAGKFRMGAIDKAEGERDEHPIHEVTLAAFYLDETEVTNEAYNEAVAAGVCVAPYPRSATANGFGRDKRFRKPRQPVSSISWDNARAYCQWRGKRLPTEAEWERAARGDDGRRYVWGNEKPHKKYAQFGASVTAKVGAHPAGAGPFGHQDLAGNVWEWVEDIYDPYAYRRATASVGAVPECTLAMAAQDDLRAKKQQGFTGSNPIPTTCERVLRGGAFNYFASGLRASNRVHHPARYRLVMSGFRCAQNVDATKPECGAGCGPKDP